MVQDLIKVYAYRSEFTHFRGEFNFHYPEYEQLKDVCITGHDRGIKAHKFILANASRYFRDILEEQNGRVDTIVLQYPAIIVDFVIHMIYGETVEVAEAQMPDLSSICKLLGVSYTVDFEGEIAETDSALDDPDYIPIDMYVRNRNVGLTFWWNILAQELFYE